MSEHDNHDLPSTTGSLPMQDIGNADASLLSRRRLLKGGAGLAPMVLTVVSRPVHAQGPICINASGFISPATYASRHPGGTPPPCTTNGPAFWSGCSPSTWPGGANTRNLIFKNVFGGSNTAKISDVLSTGSQFEKYCVAAFLNASKGVANFPLSVAQSKGLWVAIKGGTLPSGAVKPAIPVTTPAWTETTATAWLKILMS